MRYIFTSVFFLLFLAPLSASAYLSTISTSPTYTQGFSFYCQPYTTPFQAGYHYIPSTNAGTGCYYSLPSSVGNDRTIELRRGTPTNSVLLSLDTTSGGDASLIRQQPSGMPTDPVDEENFFAVVYDSNLGNAFSNYLTDGGSLPSGAIENKSYYVLPWKWGPKPVTEFDPIIIVPGILGSWEKNGEWVLDPIMHTYDNLIDTFKANGYVEGKTLFTFPYDWRNSNITTAFLLKNKIQDIKTLCKCGYVDIVAHSMGGLASLQYVESDEYQNDVDQLFLVATPLSGAPLAYQAWEGGQIDFGNVFQNTVMHVIFKNEAREKGYSSVFDYIHNGPVVSLQELLPVYQDYLYGTTTLHYPEGHPGNNFLENIVGKLGEVYQYHKVQLQVIAAELLSDGNNTTVSGFAVKTSTQLPKWEHGEPIETYKSDGDGTVPIYSISNIVEPDKLLLDVNHTGAASSSAPYVFKMLNGKSVSTVVGKNYSFLNADVRVLLFKLFSPIDMQIVAPDGKRLGKDFPSNTEISEIPDAFYSGFNTDNEYAVIVNPLPGTYKIKTVGTGAGPYTIVANYGDAATTTEAEISGTTTTGATNTYSINISATTSAIILANDTPPPPPPVIAMTPESCTKDITRAYTNKWITKISVYSVLVADCHALKGLFQTQDLIEKIVPAKRDKIKTALLATTKAAIARTLDNMDKLASDKSNTKNAVELITQITTWFRKNKL